MINIYIYIYICDACSQSSGKKINAFKGLILSNQNKKHTVNRHCG